MRIVNKSNVPIEISGIVLKPGKSHRVVEWMDRNILNIHSKIGSIGINTENGKRHFEMYGDLFATESGKKEKDGTCSILIMNI